MRAIAMFDELHVPPIVVSVSGALVPAQSTFVPEIGETGFTTMGATVSHPDDKA